MRSMIDENQSRTAEDILGPIPLFMKLPASERSELQLLLQKRHFAAQQTIVCVGEGGDDFYIVQRGQVSVSCPDETGKEVTLNTLGPGHFFGEISLLDGGPRTATVRALVDAELFVLGREPFLRFLQLHPDAAIRMLTILGQRQRETLERMRGIRNVNEAVAENRTSWHRIAEQIATVSASRAFVLFNIVLFGLWIAVNTILGRTHLFGLSPFDLAPTFSVLSFIVTSEALFVTLFVLISQNQQSERDRIRADLDYQVNLKAHQEVMQLHQKLDRLQAAIGAPPPPAPQTEEPGEE